MKNENWKHKEIHSKNEVLAVPKVCLSTNSASDSVQPEKKSCF